MPLVVTETPHGPIWENSEWDRDKPGTFAMVIGVSKYDYLPKNQEECDQELQKKADEQESFGLCQLYVSAFTAYRFFCWLQEKYRHPDLPLAKVWLLLSPTDAEIQHMPDPPQNGYRQPTFSNCQQAIIEWFTSIKTLNSFASEKSRTLFFFSGHGLELERDKQILLPSDYLNPVPVKNAATALSTYNLWTGMGATPVPEHFFFVDACRNDQATLKELEDLGIQVLPPYSWKRAKDKAIFPIVYATGPGEASFAPKDPQEGISIFGKALMECLECNEGVDAWRDPQEKYWITFEQLAEYLEPRVAQLLHGAGSNLNQPVYIELGRRWNTPICLVDPPAAMRSVRDGLMMADALPTLQPVALPQGWRGPDGEWVNTYNIVQNEFMTELLSKAKVYDLGTRLWVDIREAVATEVLTVQGIARTQDNHTYTVDVETRRRSPQWLEFTDPQNNLKAAFVLLDDTNYYPPRYTLRFDFMEKPDVGRVIAGLDVSLASSNKEVLAEAARLWNQYRGTRVSDKATPAEFALLEDLLYGKCRSPLAATAAALLLLRAWRPDLLHDWPRNLANLFPYRPDGWVIWVEQLLRTKQDQLPLTKQDEGLQEAVTAFLNLEKLPLPFTSGALGYASRQVADLLQLAFPAPENQTDEQRTQYAALQKLQQRLNRASALHRSGGFCAVFIGPEAKVTPELILPS